MRRPLAAGAFALAVLAFASPLRAQDNDPGWPRVIASPGGPRIVVYQPQPESLVGSRLAVRAAVSVTEQGSGQPQFGVVWTDASISVDRETRMVTIDSVVISGTRFANLDGDAQSRLGDLLKAEIPNWDLRIAFDRLLATLQATESVRHTDGLGSEPPRILFVQQPTLLLVFDGEPRTRPIEETKVEAVINTPFPVLKRGETWWLSVGQAWFTAPDPAAGPWTRAREQPREVRDAASKIPRDTMPQTMRAAPPAAVIPTTVPTELVVTEGEPSWQPLGDAELQYVSNTESEVFRVAAEDQVYVVLSGRWFKAASLEGPWTAVRNDSLPEEFGKIPPQGEKGGVLVYVSGTAQANEALMDAQMPTVRGVSRTSAQLTVAYDGEPKFTDIPGTRVALAENTPTEVLRIDGRYYAVDDAVWFTAESPAGPWAVADSVPAGIDSIPPSSPAHNVRYVEIYGSTPEVVYVGYTPGYIGMYPYHGAPVYGTGWSAPPSGGTWYYPHPMPYGLGLHYDPWTGWSYGMSWSAGWYHFGTAWTPSWPSGGWWGPPSYRPVNIRRPINVNRPTPFQGNAMIRRGSGIYQLPANQGRFATRPADRTADRSRARPSTQEANNVFAGRDGDVYRKAGSGWERREGTGWQNVPGEGSPDRDRPEARPAPQASPRPSTPSSSLMTGTGLASLDAQNTARGHGATRATTYQRSRPMSGGGNR